MGYKFVIRELTEDEGSGFMIEYPDLPGCMADGETIDEAIRNGEDAVECWLAAARERDGDVDIAVMTDEELKAYIAWLVREAKAYSDWNRDMKAAIKEAHERAEADEREARRRWGHLG